MGKRESIIQDLMFKHNITHGQAQDLLESKLAFEEKREARRAEQDE